MSLIWGLANARAAANAQADAATAGRDANRARATAETLEARLDRTTLACEAMWTLLRDKLGMTDNDLVDRIVELDLSDGKLDGKVAKSAVSCPKCGRTIARRFNKCMYCGQDIVSDPFS